MGRIAMILGTAVALTAWELYLKGLYLGVMAGQGYSPDFAVQLVGYLIPLTLGQLMGWWIGKRG